MAEITQSQFELPRRRVSLAEVPELAQREIDLRGRVLFLYEGDDPVPTLGMIVAAMPEGKQALDVNCQGLDTRGTLNAIGAALAGGPGRAFTAEDEPVAAIYSRIRRALAVGGTELPFLVIHGVAPAVANALFARGRDEMWSLAFSCAVAAPAADKNSYLLSISDSFFIGSIYIVEG